MKIQLVEVFEGRVYGELGDWEGEVDNFVTTYDTFQECFSSVYDYYKDLKNELILNEGDTIQSKFEYLQGEFPELQLRVISDYIDKVFTEHNMDFNKYKGIPLHTFYSYEVFDGDELSDVEEQFKSRLSHLFTVSQLGDNESLTEILEEVKNKLF